MLNSKINDKIDTTQLNFTFTTLIFIQLNSNRSRVLYCSNVVNNISMTGLMQQVFFITCFFFFFIYKKNNQRITVVSP